MAEEKEPEKKGGLFGGKGSLKEDLQDFSGDDKITFADTWLGDLLGFDGEFGVKGPGLRESWFGARRDGPGSKANKPNLFDIAGTGGPRRGGKRRDLDITLEEIGESGSGMDVPESDLPEESKGGRVRYRRALDSTGGPARYRNVPPEAPLEEISDLEMPTIGVDTANMPTDLETRRDRIGDTGRSISPLMPRPPSKDESADTIKATVNRIFRTDVDVDVDTKIAAVVEKYRPLTPSTIDKIIKEVNKLPDSFDKKKAVARLKTLKGSSK